MRQRCFITLWILTVFTFYIFDGWALDIGSRIDNFRLSDVSGTEQSLQSYSGKIVVLVFWSFKCPTSLFYAERVQKLHDTYSHRGVVLLEVSSAPNEKASEIRANIANLNLTIPFLMDTDGFLAEKLGATQTPSLFIFDEAHYLRYAGALDNNRKIGESGRIAYAEDALEALLAFRPISVPKTKNVGCALPGRGIAR